MTRDRDSVRPDHSKTDSLPMRDAFIAHRGLDAVRDRMSVVEQSAEICFVGVLRDNRGFYGDRAPHDRLENHRIASCDCLSLELDQVKERRVTDDSALERLERAGTDFLLGKGIQEVDVSDHRFRRVKTSDEILSRRVIDRDFSSDAAVNLSEQRRRNVHKAHASEIDRCSKSCGVTEGTSTDRDDDCIPSRAAREQIAGETDDSLESLGPFAVRQRQYIDASEAICECVSGDFHEPRSRDDERRASRRHLSEDRASVSNDSPADEDGILGGLVADYDCGLHHSCRRFNSRPSS